MKLKLLSGFMTLQLATAMSLSAQTYTFTVGNSQNVLKVADHIGGEDLTVSGVEQTLEVYNLDVGDLKCIGLSRFEGASGNLLFARHHALPGATDYLKALKGFQTAPKQLYIVAERLSQDGIVRSAVLLRYDKDNGNLISAVEFPFLPSGYSYIHVFDVMENFAVNIPKRILCTVDNGSNTPVIVELLYNDVSNTYKVRQYKDASPPKEYWSVHYVRAYHYGSVSLMEPSFYGLANDGETRSAFCFYNDPGNGVQIYEKYYLTSLSGIKGITGVQMNGSYGPNGNHNRIEMAFTDEEGGICIQQKDELTTTNWQRFYQFPDKQEFLLGWGRDGHGTKMGPGVGEFNSNGYFLGAWMPSADEPEKSLVTALHFSGVNGDLAPPRTYKMTGLGIFKNGSFPSTSYDPGYYYGDYVNNYTFIADGIEPQNGFRFGTGNTLVTINKDFFCSSPIKINRAKDKRLKSEVVPMYVSDEGTYEPKKLEPKEYDIPVEVKLDCKATHVLPEQIGARGVAPDNTIEVGMDAYKMKLAATGKKIASVHVFSVDGRSVAEAKGVDAMNFTQQFARPLTPGIYVVQIEYADHTKDVKKVSVQ